MKLPRAAASVILAALLANACSTTPNDRAAETRALAFLQREVPAWSRDNGCYSCHNNGDAARALYVATRHGFQVPNDALNTTTRWLTQPNHWDKNQGDPGFSDQRLADVQFAAALLTATQTGHADKAPLTIAAQRLLQSQSANGTWPVDAGNRVGSPATYGTTLATFLAWQTLTASGLPEAHNAIARAERALQETLPNNVPDAATLLRFAVKHPADEADALRERTLTFLRTTQNGDGGWGPYRDSPSEVFDTALALLALAELPHEHDVATMRTRGKKFLLSVQMPDGSWAATTRPSGGISYAQQMSTTGWATLALLATPSSR
jgi:hypothetical protein